MLCVKWFFNAHEKIIIRNSSIWNNISFFAQAKNVLIFQNKNKTKYALRAFELVS